MWPLGGHCVVTGCLHNIYDVPFILFVFFFFLGCCLHHSDVTSRGQAICDLLLLLGCFLLVVSQPFPPWLSCLLLPWKHREPLPWQHALYSLKPHVTAAVGGFTGLTAVCTDGWDWWRVEGGGRSSDSQSIKCKYLSMISPPPQLLVWEELRLEGGSGLLRDSDADEVDVFLDTSLL